MRARMAWAVMGIKDLRCGVPFHGLRNRGDIAMNAGKPVRLDRAERVVRGMLAIALIAAVVWAVTDGGTASEFTLHRLWG